MPDRPPESPEPGTPEYEWLYGKAPQQPEASPDETTEVIRQVPESGPENGPEPDADEPEPTRVMPVQGAGPTRPTAEPRSAPPPPRTPPPGEPSGGGGGGGRRFRMPRPRFRPIRWILLLVLLWIIYLIVVPIVAVQKVSTVDAFPDGDRPGDQDGTTYLVVGSDKADDLSDEQREELDTPERSGTNTDTIMLLHTGDGPNVLTSIPRDTLVEIPGHGTSMINSAFSQGGPKLLVETVENLTGVRVDHYVELGFGSVINTVDALGGIEICPKIDMKDKAARLDIEKGCQEVDGLTALGYSRSRHVTARSDLDRVGRQREVVSSLGDKVLSPWTFLNPVRYWRFNMAAANAIRVSDGTGIFDLARFARAMTKVGGEDGDTCTMPIMPSPEDPNRLAMDEERADELFSHIIEDDTEDIPADACTATGLPKSVTG